MPPTKTPSGSPSLLLKLPEELLLEIALGTDVIGIKGLRLTCRRLRPVARESLIRNAPPVKLDALWVLVDELQKWDLSKKIPRICLGSTSEAMATQQVEERVRLSMTNHGRAQYRAIIQSAVPPQARQNCSWVKGFDKILDGLSFRSNDVSAMGISLLFALTPLTTTLVVPLTTLLRYNVVGNMVRQHAFYHPEWQSWVFSMLRDRIEVLEITEDIVMKVEYSNGMAPRMVANTDFNNLRRLVIPFQLLLIEPAAGHIQGNHSCMVSHLVRPSAILLASLEVLRLENCASNQGDYDWDAGVYFVTSLTYFLMNITRMKQLQLVFEDCLVPIAQWLRYGTSAEILNRIATIREWQLSSTLKVEYFFLDWVHSEGGPQKIQPKRYAKEEDLAMMMQVYSNGPDARSVPANSFAWDRLYDWQTSLNEMI